MTRAFATLVAALVVAASACSSSSDDDDGDPGGFDLNGYDRSCAATSDCDIVYSSDPCGCECAHATIASSERPRYDADADAYRRRVCPDGGLVCGPCPPGPGVECSGGMCVVLP